MSNLQKFAILIPETFYVSNMKVVRSNYPLLDRGNGTLQRTVEFTDGTACSLNIPSNNEAIKGAISAIHSGDCFRVAFKGEALPKEKDGSTSTTPSGMPTETGGKFKVKSWYQSPIVIWDSYQKQEAGALYADVVLPDFSDRSTVGVTVLPPKQAVQPTTELNNSSDAF